MIQSAEREANQQQHIETKTLSQLILVQKWSFLAAFAIVTIIYFELFNQSTHTAETTSATSETAAVTTATTPTKRLHTDRWADSEHMVSNTNKQTKTHTTSRTLTAHIWLLTAREHMQSANRKHQRLDWIETEKESTKFNHSKHTAETVARSSCASTYIYPCL